MTTEAAQPTAVAWDSSTEEPDMPQLTQSSNTSRSCANVFCLPLSPWTKSEPRPTSMPTSVTTTSASGCSQVLSPSRTPSAMSFNFTDSCNSNTDMAEDCRATLNCDTARDLCASALANVESLMTTSA
ncbi:hypothetical protein TrVFT333_005061 [Trichoderma virens FT-333]|nr:hypothetical protein TrVFT333_005061 [Trichoderma virens FT-333]